MLVGKLSIEVFAEDHTLAIINCDNGDHYEIAGFTSNYVRHRAEDFCRVNQIVLKQVPHREGSSVFSRSCQFSEFNRF